MGREAAIKSEGVMSTKATIQERRAEWQANTEAGRRKFEAMPEETQGRAKAFLAENEHGPAFALLRKSGLEIKEASAAIAWLEGVRPE